MGISLPPFNGNNGNRDYPDQSPVGKVFTPSKATGISILPLIITQGPPGLDFAEAVTGKLMRQPAYNCA